MDEKVHMINHHNNISIFVYQVRLECIVIDLDFLNPTETVRSDITVRPVKFRQHPLINVANPDTSVR